MKELTPFEGFQEHTLSLSVCFLLCKASLLVHFLSPCSMLPTAAQLHPESAVAWLVVAVSQIQTSHFPLTSCQFCWQTFLLTCCLTRQKWTLVREPGGLIFLIPQDSQHGFRGVQKQWGTLTLFFSRGSHSRHGSQSGKLTLTLLPLPAPDTSLIAASALA